MTVMTTNMKMSQLVDENHHLLGMLSRVGIEGAFGDRSVAEICSGAGLDPDTFLLLCRVYTSPDYRAPEELLRRCHIGDVLRYIHQSHGYYLNYAIDRLAAGMEDLIKPCSPQQKEVIWKFFTDYKNELEKHFQYEEGKVIPYVQALLLGQRNPSFSISRFEENHSNMDETLSDLKNLIMNSLPGECSNAGRVELLEFIFALRSDLERHTCIEDNVLVPMVQLMENPFLTMDGSPREWHSQEQPREELSDREKEILVSVAKGLLNKEIADRHNISINTVITHRKNITRKTGIKTVAGLTVYAILNNLIDINSVK